MKVKVFSKRQHRVRLSLSLTQLEVVYKLVDGHLSALDCIVDRNSSVYGEVLELKSLLMSKVFNERDKYHHNLPF